MHFKFGERSQRATLERREEDEKKAPASERQLETVSHSRLEWSLFKLWLSVAIGTLIFMKFRPHFRGNLKKLVLWLCLQMACWSKWDPKILKNMIDANEAGVQNEAMYWMRVSEKVVNSCSLLPCSCGKQWNEILWTNDKVGPLFVSNLPRTWIDIPEITNRTDHYIINWFVKFRKNIS